MFTNKKKNDKSSFGRIEDFKYISNDDIYMDSACQSVRPQPVIDAMVRYYQHFNACGGRGKYRWANEVDSQINSTRESVLKYLHLSSKDYVCSFTLNTTYGINLILSQLPGGLFNQIITSEIEHNSVFLPIIELSKRLNIKSLILPRDKNGGLVYEKNILNKPVVVVNSASNIDGRLLINIKQLSKDVHAAGGILIIDAAQTMAHHHEILIGCDADVICFSAHKMYAPSLGGIVIKKNLLKKLEIKFIGGGMIMTLKGNDYELDKNEPACLLEPGLQSYGEIISLKTAIEWLSDLKIDGLKPSDYIEKLSNQLYSGLSEIPGVKLFNKSASPVISIYSDKIDSHRLGIFLSGYGIMVRSGYFCCHHYLLDELKMPPLLRFSIGLHTTENDIIKTLETIKKFL